jgi:carboxypeptidase Taq
MYNASKDAFVCQVTFKRSNVVATAGHNTVQQLTSEPQFTRSDTRIAELLDQMTTIMSLGALSSLAAWDMNTQMPEGAGEMRGSQMAVMQGILHDKWVDKQLGKLIQDLAPVVQQSSYTDADRGLVRVALRNYEQSTKLPRTLVEEMARNEATSFEAWRKARANNDFASFAPSLARTVALQREVADFFGYTESRYDALLDIYEPGLTTSRVDALFAPVRSISSALLQRIQQGSNTVDTAPLEGEFAVDKQVQLCTDILKAMGYDFTHGAIAQSPHPFTINMGAPFDVRVTVRANTHLLQQSIMAAIHEGGHALYEQGSAATLANTPVVGGASMGIHESQSRLWENAVGRSVPFWQGQYHLVREAFPDKYANIDAAAFARALNHVEPSLIRVEADEVTYNLHIIIRFELEKQMINGEVSVESLPRLWNEKYKEYLGIQSETDSDGILQDVHWTSGFGYFPTYTIGNLCAAQILHTLYKAIPDLDERLAKGDTATLLTWLREHLYQYGAIYLPDELMRRVTGEPLDSSYFLKYLTGKFEQVYGLGGTSK